MHNVNYKNLFCLNVYMYCLNNSLEFKWRGVNNELLQFLKCSNVVQAEGTSSDIYIYPRFLS